MSLRFFLLFVAIFFCQNSFGQHRDLIVTHNNDSIRCRILQLNPGEIKFMYKTGGVNETTDINRETVASYSYNFFGQKKEVLETYVPQEKQVEIKKSKNYNPPKSLSWAKRRKGTNYRLALSGGWSYRLAKLADVQEEFREYQKSLKTGSNANLSLHFAISEALMLGANYSRFRSKSRVNIVVDNPDGTTFQGILEDDISIQFYAPSLAVRMPSKNEKNHLTIVFSLGYVTYKNNSSAPGRVLITGQTFGWSGDFGYDIGLSKNLALSLSASVFSSTILNFTVDNGFQTQNISLNPESPEGLGRVDLSLGLVFTP